jgi:hypothetical protein
MLRENRNEREIIAAVREMTGEPARQRERLGTWLRAYTVGRLRRSR